MWSGDGGLSGAGELGEDWRWEGEARWGEGAKVRCWKGGWVCCLCWWGGVGLLLALLGGSGLLLVFC